MISNIVLVTQDRVVAVTVGVLGWYLYTNLFGGQTERVWRDLERQVAMGRREVLVIGNFNASVGRNRARQGGLREIWNR